TTTAPRIISSTFSGPSSASLNTIRVTFDQAMTLSSFTPGDVSLTSPTARTIPMATIKVVSGSNDKAFDLGFITQTLAGKYPLKSGPSVTTLSGVQMAKHETPSPLPAQPAPATQPASNTTPVNVPTLGRGVSMVYFAQEAIIADASVKLNITRPWTGDLYISL